jgi:hypothetical protein
MKIVVCKNIIEIYKYQKIPKQENKQLKELEKKDIDINRIEEYIKTSQYVSRETIRRYALNNFENGNLFITLTFEDNVSDHDYCNNEFKKFILRLKRQSIKFNIDLKYIAVIEYQERGALHYHLLTNFPKELIKGSGYKIRNKYFQNRYWKNGIVVIKNIKDVDNVGAYLVKYIIKDLTTIKGKQRYLKSNNLDKPKVYTNFGENITNLNIRKIINELNPNYLVYTSEYENEFWGNIQYKEYNINRPYLK